MRTTIVIVDSSSSLGGAELSMLPVARELARAHPVVAFLPGPGPLEQPLVDAGVGLAPDFYLPRTLSAASGTYRPSKRRSALGAVRVQWRMARALRRARPAVVYCNGFRAQVGVTLPARLSGARVVWHVRDFARPGMLGTVWSGLSRLADLIIANSEATAAQSQLRPARDRVAVISNGIDVRLFSRRQQEPEGPPVLGMAGHLTPWKGHLGFLELLAEVRGRFPTVYGRIAGGSLYETSGHDEYVSQLRGALDRLGLNDCCVIENVAPTQMAAWYQQLTVLVHCPEQPEPFGRVLAEAQAVGVPIAALDRGAVAEVVGDAGIVIAPGHNAELTRAVEALLADKAERTRLGAIGAARARHLFDERRYVATVIDALLSPDGRA